MSVPDGAAVKRPDLGSPAECQYIVARDRGAEALSPFNQTQEERSYHDDQAQYAYRDYTDAT